MLIWSPGKRPFPDSIFKSLRSNISAMKKQACIDREQLQQQFIDQATAAGATVYRAATADDANRYIAELAVKKAAKLVVKSKSNGQ